MRFWTVLLSLCTFYGLANAQLIAKTIGGRWTYEISKDKLTDQIFSVIELKADAPIADAISSGIPSFVIMCGGNRWINSKVVSPVVLGASGKFRSALGPPQQLVYLRADNKLHVHFWNIADDYRALFVDKGATKELINSADARIQFHDSANQTQVAQFSPVGLDRDALTRACGNSFK